MVVIDHQGLVTIGPNFTSQNGWTNCHRRLDQLSQVTISPPSPRGGPKICGNDTGTKKMWVKKFKSPTVTRPTVWVKLSLGLNVGGLNVKTQ
jgi:hypothetical protein